MQAWRHDIHRHPELAFEEQRTAARVAELLDEFGLEVHTGIGNTGVVGVLRKGSGERMLGLRADMDALRIQEQNQFGHRSLHDGKMHACGHDGHTAMPSFSNSDWNSSSPATIRIRRGPSVTKLMAR